LSALAIIADDLTGALDTGIKFSKTGIGTQVVMGHKFCSDDIDLDKEVLVIDTETRHVSENEAYARVYKTAKQCLDIGIKHFYKKTDSALRGHIGSELAALYDVLGKPVAFIPALPRENRTTEKGIHYIDGVPVAESIFGRDPLNPVRHSEIFRLLEEETGLSVCSIEGKRPAEWPDGQVVVFDASTDEELKQIGGYLVDHERLQVTAGCAGFAKVLSEVLPFSERTERNRPQSSKLFVLCGSVNDVSSRQLLFAARAGYTRISLSQEQKLGDHYLNSVDGERFLSDIKNLCREKDRLIIDVFSEHTIEDAAAYADAEGIDREEISGRIAERLAELGSQILSLKEDASILVIGGDTLYAFMQALSKPVLDPVCEPVPGTVSMLVKTNDGHIFPLISKSGGFGQEDLIIETEKHVLKKGGI